MSKGSEWGRRKRADIVSACGSICFWEGCTERFDLHFAHLSHTDILDTPNGHRGRGTNSKMRDVLNNLDKYAILCPDHHAELDARVPELSPRKRGRARTPKPGAAAAAPS